jgi:nicotinate-nucleotide adenylyltransferase
MRTSEEPRTQDRPARRRVCLFGGSFDPVHEGHLAMARTACTACRFKRVIFLPARHSPHKSDSPQAPAADRLAMLNLAVGDFPWAEVSNWEIERPAPSFSWQTADHFASLLGPEVELWWLLGDDQWRVLESWARPERLASQLRFAVVPRGEARVLPKPGFRHEMIAFSHPASATAVRHAVKQGQSLDGLVPVEVAEYIREHGLYR